MHRLLAVLVVAICLSPGLFWRDAGARLQGPQPLTIRPLALPENGRLAPGLTVAGVWRLDSSSEDFGGYSALLTLPGGELLAVGALAVLDEVRGHGELKSMHTRGDLRRTGIARTLLRRLLDEARALGLHTVSLETGTQPEFAPARALYASEGFEVCGPFGDYAESPFSTFMTRAV